MISIVIPVYNCEKYIDVCIQSALKQTFTEFELILIDDGSTDNSGKICDNYSKMDVRIKVVHQRNLGASAARNNGIDVAQGEYITFLDSDDYWLDKNILSQIMSRLVETKADILSFNFCKVKEDTIMSPYFTVKESMPISISEEEALTFIAKNNLWIASAWNKVIKKELFDKFEIKFIEGITAEDIGWCAKLALVATRFDYLDVLGVGYVQRTNSVSNTLDAKKVNSLKRNIDEVLVCAKNASEEKKKILYPYLAYQIGTLMLDISLLEDSKEKEQLIKDANEYLPYLKYSNEKKIRLMDLMSSVMGFKGLLFLLKIYSKLRQ